MESLGTSYGLALAAGINAYLPLLSISISVRWFHLFTISKNFAFLTQNGFIIALVILAVIDIVADKIPFVDSIWDSIHTIVRPISGAIVAGATGESSTSLGLPVVLLLGATLASMSHITKAVTRLSASVSAGGCLTLALSLVEDVVVIVAILLALFAPVIMLAFSAIFIVLFVIFAPLLFSALRYRLRVAASTFSWFIHSYFWRGSESSSLDFMLDLSDAERSQLLQIMPPETALLGGARVQWIRRLDGRGLWGRRRVALSTWFIVSEGAVIILCGTRPHLSQVVFFNDVQALALDQGLLMGSLRLLTLKGQAINFAILRDSLGDAIELVEVLHTRHHLPSNATTRTGSIRTRSVGPQRI
ncbi:MAG: DUF4126 domain-containing protein [Ktedonobacteraceae bacterium]